MAAVAPRALLRSRGWSRLAASAAIVALVLLVPVVLADTPTDVATRGLIYAVIGLSLNVLLGHAGQISLGHQAFVGVGAFVSGYMVTEVGASFYLALTVSALFGALSALVLGIAALRVRGLYLALITLAYGFVAQESIFEIRSLTGGGAGMPAPRPAAFESDTAYYYLCAMILALVLVLDWRLMKTKAGRAIVAIRHDERVAATMGVNVTFYKIFAFCLSGFIAGIAGSLFAHWATAASTTDYLLEIAIVWVFMTVVGGLESRAGIVVGSIFFAIFPFLLESLPVSQSLKEALPRYVPLIGAILLVLTLTLYPGGIGQQLLPLRRWLAGGPLHVPRQGHRRRKGKAKAEGPETGEGAGIRGGSAGDTDTPTATTEEPGRAEAAATPDGDGDGQAAPAATETMPLPPAIAEGNGETAPEPVAKPRRKRLGRRGGKA